MHKPVPRARKQVQAKSASQEELISAALVSTSPMPAYAPRKAQPHRIGKLEAAALKVAKAAAEQAWSSPGATVRHLSQQAAASPAATKAASAPAAQTSGASKVASSQADLDAKAHLDEKYARVLKSEVGDSAEDAANGG